MVKSGFNTFNYIVGYPTIYYPAMLRCVPWAICLGKPRNHELIMRQCPWLRKKTTAENLQMKLRFIFKVWCTIQNGGLHE